MYSPWFSSMPGFNDPTYWNYENDKLDEITQKIYTGDFKTVEERSQLIQEAVVEGVNESVRIFLASKIDQYVANEKVSGIVNDFGAGVPSRFTPINAKSDSNEFVIGVKQLYQGAWNPVMGLTDSYSRSWSIQTSIYRGNISSQSKVAS
jgi:peptide/nickel transport system substrate-binding protein